MSKNGRILADSPILLPKLTNRAKFDIIESLINSQIRSTNLFLEWCFLFPKPLEINLFRERKMNQNEEGEIRRWVVLTQDILGAEDINATDKIVLAHISGFEQFYASNETTAAFLGMTARNIQAIKQKLVRLNYLKVLRDTGRGKVYQFNVERLTKFCQSDSQNSVNQNTSILPAYNKDKNKDKVFIGEKNEKEPVENSEYGRADINELEALWERETGISIKGQQTQRRQLYNLTRKYGLDKTKRIIEQVGKAAKSNDRFAPLISTPSDLTGKYEKLSKLILWHNRNLTSRPFGNQPTPAPKMATASLKTTLPDYGGAFEVQSDAERAKVSEMIRQTRKKLNK